MDSGFNDTLSTCVEKLSLIDISKYEIENSEKMEYTYKRWEAKNSYQAELRVYTEVPNKLTFDDLMRTPLTRAMKKREYDMFMKAILESTIDLEYREFSYHSTRCNSDRVRIDDCK